MYQELCYTVLCVLSKIPLENEQTLVTNESVEGKEVIR